MLSERNLQIEVPYGGALHLAFHWLAVLWQLPASDYNACTKLSWNFPMSCWSFESSYSASYINLIFDL